MVLTLPDYLLVAGFGSVVAGLALLFGAGVAAVAAGAGLIAMAITLYRVPYRVKVEDS